MSPRDTTFLDVAGGPFEADPDSHTGQTSTPVAPAHLAVHNLTVTYGDLTALHNVSCEAAAGSVLAVTGPSGAGKSTLLWSMASALEDMCESGREP